MEAETCDAGKSGSMTTSAATPTDFGDCCSPNCAANCETSGLPDISGLGHTDCRPLGNAETNTSAHARLSTHVQRRPELGHKPRQGTGARQRLVRGRKRKRKAWGRTRIATERCQQVHIQDLARHLLPEFGHCWKQADGSSFCPSMATHILKCHFHLFRCSKTRITSAIINVYSSNSTKVYGIISKLLISLSPRELHMRLIHVTFPAQFYSFCLLRRLSIASVLFTALQTRTGKLGA
uniref:Uncharacterized protein LOC117354923 n=1 Tax=Geotrypetes seraphini TaxID=260995 RepID=A0A6P8QQ80_GEOSA|nr:uncharacterized protein LOC117354923 [Geotrypetes seraphini]